MARICVLAPSFDRYSETFIRDQLRNFKSEVVKVSLTDGLYRDEANATIISTSFLGRVLLAGERVVTNKRFEYQQNLALSKYFRKNQISHVLVHFGLNAVKVLDACKLANANMIVHFHGYDAYRYDVLSLFGNGYKEVFEYAKAVIVVSEHMKKQLINLGAPKEKVIKITYGIDKEQFKYNPAVKKPIGTIKFVSVGRFVEKKAPHLTILSFYKAYLENQNIRLVMIGEGPLLPICKEIVNGLKISKFVEFVGALSHDEVVEIMMASDAFLQHSKTAESGDNEGTPVAILEALSIGLPVVSTNHAGIPEVVKNNENGFLSEENDVEAMAENLLRVVNCGQAKSLYSNALINVHDLKVQVQKLESIILE